MQESEHRQSFSSMLGVARRFGVQSSARLPWSPRLHRSYAQPARVQTSLSPEMKVGPAAHGTSMPLSGSLDAAFDAIGSSSSCNRFPLNLDRAIGGYLCCISTENLPASGLGVIWPPFGLASRTCHVALCGARISHNACLSLGHHVRPAHGSLACSALPKLMLHILHHSFTVGGLRVRLQNA